LIAAEKIFNVFPAKALSPLREDDDGCWLQRSSISELTGKTF
jgi:hypothetical protein